MEENEEKSRGQRSLTSTASRQTHVVQEDKDHIFEKSFGVTQQFFIGGPDENMDRIFEKSLGVAQHFFIEEHGEYSPGFGGACCWSWEAAAEKMGLVKPGVKGFGGFPSCEETIPLFEGGGMLEGFGEATAVSGKASDMAAIFDTGESITDKAKDDARDIGQFLGFLGKHLGKEQGFNNYCYEGARPPGQLVGVSFVPGTFDHASKDDFARKAWHGMGFLVGRTRSRSSSRTTSAKRAKWHRSQEGSDKDEENPEVNSDI